MTPRPTTVMQETKKRTQLISRTMCVTEIKLISCCEMPNRYVPTWNVAETSWRNNPTVRTSTDRTCTQTCPEHGTSVLFWNLRRAMARNRPVAVRTSMHLEKPKCKSHSGSAEGGKLRPCRRQNGLRFEEPRQSGEPNSNAGGRPTLC